MLVEATKNAHHDASTSDSAASDLNFKPNNPQINVSLADSNSEAASVDGSPTLKLPKLISPMEEVIVQSEMEAAKLLLQLGISSDRLTAPCNGDARDSITGAYRIMLHQLQRYYL